MELEGAQVRATEAEEMYREALTKKFRCAHNLDARRMGECFQCKADVAGLRKAWQEAERVVVQLRNGGLARWAADFDGEATPEEIAEADGKIDLKFEEQLVELRDGIARRWFKRGRDGDEIAQEAVCEILDLMRRGVAILNLPGYLWTAAKHIEMKELGHDKRHVQLTTRDSDLTDSYDSNPTNTCAQSLEIANSGSDHAFDPSKNAVEGLTSSDTFEIAAAYETMGNLSPTAVKYLELGSAALTPAERVAVSRERAKAKAEWYGVQPAKGTDEPLADESLDHAEIGDESLGVDFTTVLYYASGHRRAYVRTPEEEEKAVFPVRGKADFTEAELEALRLRTIEVLSNIPPDPPLGYLLPWAA